MSRGSDDEGRSRVGDRKALDNGLLMLPLLQTRAFSLYLSTRTHYPKIGGYDWCLAYGLIIPA